MLQLKKDQGHIFVCLDEAVGESDPVKAREVVVLPLAAVSAVSFDAEMKLSAKGGGRYLILITLRVELPSFSPVENAKVFTLGKVEMVPGAVFPDGESFANALMKEFCSFLFAPCQTAEATKWWEVVDARHEKGEYRLEDSPAAPERAQVKKALWRRRVVPVLVVCALTLIGYGAYDALSKRDDPYQAALQGDAYKGVQDRIRAQIEAAKRGDGGGFGLKGENNVTLDTLRAMGLDPGKANAGCLVGTK